MILSAGFIPENYTDQSIEGFNEGTSVNVEVVKERENFPHKHNWVDGYCDLCTAHCVHEWKDGRCEKCKMFCPHNESHDKNTLICSICGQKVYHKYSSGICVGCGKEPDFVDNWPDDLFFEQCKHPGETTLHRVRIGNTGWYKKISVHTPYGYTPEKKYNVMFMMAGLHCPFNQWTDLLMWDHGGIRTDNFYDNMFEQGICEPCIVVSFSDSSLMGKIRETDEVGGFDSLYACEGNLVDGIIPFVIENYSTYAQGTTREDMVAARKHFGMGGFSNGGYNTYFTGLRCMGDVFANFAPFAGTIQPENVARSYNENFSQYPIDVFYAGCGRSDQENYKCLPAYEIMIEKVPQLEEGKNAWYGQPAGYHTWQAAIELTYNAFQVMFPADARESKSSSNINFDGIEKSYSLNNLSLSDKKNYVETITLNRYNGIGCIEVVPKIMQDNLPLVVFLAGNNGYENLGCNFFMQYIESGSVGKDFIFVAPNNSSKYGSNTRNLMSFIREVAKAYNVNKEKIIIIGASAGAGQAGELISENPDYFALGILISGYMGGMDKNIKTPVLFTAGSGGEWEYALPEKQELWSKEINDNGGISTFVLLEEANHADTPNILALPFIWKLIFSV